MSRPLASAARKNDAEASFHEDLVGLIPHIRAFARSLCRDPDLADDLTQDTLAKAWEARWKFRYGTNLKAWLFTILRNNFYSDRRRAWREAPLAGEAAQGSIADNLQFSAVQLAELSGALQWLSDDQRDALILVSAAGFSCETAAAVCGCAVGTIKSRVARARKILLDILDSEAAVPPKRPPASSSEAILCYIEQSVRRYAQHLRDAANADHPG